MTNALPLELTDALEDFGRRRAWGQIQIDFQRGQIVLVRKTETMTTPDSRKLHRENNQRHDFANS
jgi:hypothetical protein